MASHRLSINLPDRSQADLDYVMELDETNQTETVKQALRALRYLREAKESGKEILIRSTTPEGKERTENLAWL